MDRTTFGTLLREARQRALLTLESLSEASGVSVRAISDMERGHSLPRQATLGELMDALRLGEDQRRRFVEASQRRAVQVPRQLPPDLAAFRGRDEALATVRALTAQAGGRGGRVVVSAIGGMAGVGKTTLAVHWAHQVADRFPDGQLYVNLRGFEDVRPLDPADALAGFLGALGVPSREIPRGTDERSALFRERTASRQLVVVLDNARSEEQVRPLLPASTECLTIVTSRRRLSGLAVTDDAHLVSLDVWPRAEALAALAGRIGERRCAAEPEAAARLVELCGLLPLAIAIVGAQLSAAPQVPLRLAVRELREAGTRLDALSADDRRADVRAAFSWSYRALAPATARFFRLLALHPGTAVSAEAAASVAGTALPVAHGCLRELTAANLLSRDAQGRYVLHDLLRAYGAERAEQEGEDRGAALARLLEYLRHNAHTANRYLGDPVAEPDTVPAPGVVVVPMAGRDEALDWFRQEEPGVAAALRAMDDDPRLLRIGVRLTDHWVSYYSVTGQWTEEIVTKRIGVDAALRLDDPAAIARNAASLARALAETGRLNEADRQIEVLLGRLDRLDLPQRAAAERSIGWVRGRQQRPDLALHHARRALESYRALGDEPAAARELNAVGWYLALLGRYEEAVALCEEALPLLRRHGNLRIEAAARDSMGYARQRLGDLDAAVADYEESLRLYGEASDGYNQAEVLDHLASAELERGDHAAARAHRLRAADLLDAVGSPRADAMRAAAPAVEPPADTAGAG